MAEYKLIISLAVALGVGLIIGLQREQSAGASEQDDGNVVGGIRTFPLFAIAGALSALAARALAPWVVAATLLALMLPVSIAYAIGLRHGKNRGIASEAALVTTFLLGVLAVSDQVILQDAERLLFIAAVAVIVTTLLSLRDPLHSFAAKFSRDDMYTTVKFLVLAVIVLPLLPNSTFGPLDVLNPFKIGIMIVLLSGVGLIGYVLVRVLGPGRGLGLAGLFGGMASSTAVTLAFSRRARNEPDCLNECIIAVVLASAVMPIRVIMEVAAVNAPLTAYAAAPMAVLTLAGLATSYAMSTGLKQSPDDSEHVQYRNPLEFRFAVYFGVLFGAILLASKAALIYFGNRGLLVSSAISGMIDLDAITISIANMAHVNSSDSFLAVAGIFIAVTSNTIIKALIALSLGGWKFGWRVLVSFAISLLAGGTALLVMWYLISA